ncbi:MAG: pseudouridine-5'-phosphate glycosidase [Propionicimonas sp.]
MNDPHPMLAVTDEVRGALASGRPVVALESTIISHGMPYPKNVQTAREVEQIIREHGAVPATVAVLHGVPRIGLDDAELDLLGSNGHVRKVSIRDLPHVIARSEHGATTVASTMRLAALAGIRVFVTGGLGGVHRGGEASMDISADLTELSLTDVAVVSAGVKSLLDIGRTLEVLETLGVPVVTIGSDDFPSFYSRSSGFRSPLRLDQPGEVAALMRAKWDLGLAGGIVVANPIPVTDEIPEGQISLLITQAVTEAEERGITGAAITPFLLGRIVELSGGDSLRANIALVKNNAVLGARVAVAYAG